MYVLVNRVKLRNSEEEVLVDTLEDTETVPYYTVTVENLEVLL